MDSSYRTPTFEIGFSLKDRRYAMSNLTDNYLPNHGGNSSLSNGASPCACQNTTSGSIDRAETSDAFVYIIVVLSFYATSMVLLMIKYIRREEEEVYLDYYYTEFVKRDKFQSARFRNKMALEKANEVGALDFINKNKYYIIDESKNQFEKSLETSDIENVDNDNSQMPRANSIESQALESVV